MGYNLYITRADFHFDNEGHWITAEEWLRYVEEDPELKLAGYNGDYFALWSGLSSYPDPWLDWFEGNILSKNPDDSLIDKMIEIARNLHAKVQGDDGETYTGGGAKNFLPPPEPQTPPSELTPRGRSLGPLHAVVLVAGLIVPLALYGGRSGPPADRAFWLILCYFAELAVWIAAELVLGLLRGAHRD